MSLYITIESESTEIKLPESTIENYSFEYAIGSSYTKVYPKLFRLCVTIDVMEIMSMDSLPGDNLKLLQELRNWSEFVYVGTNTSGEYFRKVTLNNYFDNEEVRTIILSHAYVNKAKEFLDPSECKHTITLELLQRGDKLNYARS